MMKNVNYVRMITILIIMENVLKQFIVEEEMIYSNVKVVFLVIISHIIIPVQMIKIVLMGIKQLVFVLIVN